MTLTTDVAIIGGGPGGCTAAMFLAQRGTRSIIIEREAFPRYHIGESMTGECAGILRRLGLEEQMLAEHHPQKQGVKVYTPSGDGHWYVPVMRRTEAGGLEPASTYSVRRSSSDLFAGRIYKDHPSLGAQALRHLARAGLARAS